MFQQASPASTRRSCQTLERMSPATHLGRRVLLSLGAFLVLTISGSVLVGLECFPAVSHIPASPGCNIGLFSPLFAAVISGLVFGHRVPVAMSPFAAIVSVVGLSTLFLTGHLHYWVGQDIAAALQLAGIYCLIPSAGASAVSATIYSWRGAYAL